MFAAFSASLRFSGSYTLLNLEIISLKSEVEHETKFYLLIFYSTHVWMAKWNRHLTFRPLMVGIVSSIPTGGNFIFC